MFIAKPAARSRRSYFIPFQIRYFNTATQQVAFSSSRRSLTPRMQPGNNLQGEHVPIEWRTQVFVE